jgi:uncharacterized membrane protein YeiH
LLSFASSIHVGGVQWSGNFTTIDLIAAATNSLNGALLARRPDHYKNWTVVGIIAMALLMGLGGGMTRDVLVNQIPTALTNPAFIVTALGFGILGYLLAYKSGQLFREGLFQFVTSFSLPWYAIAGAQKGVIGPTAGRWYVDVSSGVPPKHFVRGEWFIATALITGVVWVIAEALGASTWLAAGIALAFGYTFRVIALYRAWEEPLAKEPGGVYLHDDGRPMLGRKIKGKSERELRSLGLVVDRDGLHVDPKLNVPVAGHAADGSSP